MEPTTEELLIFFKALADANRLKIIGLLAQQPLTVEQLAAILNLGASTVSHHLSRLAEAGLVSAKAHSYYSIYQLEGEALEAKARRLLARETLPAMAADIDIEAFDRKVLADYLLPDGQLKVIPSQQKKLHVILHRIIQDFNPGDVYSEKQVNEILSGYHEDTASLRRELISTHLLSRKADGTAYWVTSDPTEVI
jgi:DNA-binding transcriptional ArsR family regulator